MSEADWTHVVSFPSPADRWTPCLARQMVKAAGSPFERDTHWPGTDRGSLEEPAVDAAGAEVAACDEAGAEVSAVNPPGAMSRRNH